MPSDLTGEGRAKPENALRTAFLADSCFKAKSIHPTNHREMQVYSIFCRNIPMHKNELPTYLSIHCTRRERESVAYHED